MKMFVAALVMLAVSNVAHAGIQWSWVNAGTSTEQGTFITDGELVGDVAPPGTYTVRQFSVTTSAHGLLIGDYPDGGYICQMPCVGFDWDGSECTCFWRDSGTWTNGFDFVVEDPLPDVADWIVFSVGVFVVGLYEEIDYLHEEQTAIITPIATVVGTVDSSMGALKAAYR